LAGSTVPWDDLAKVCGESTFAAVREKEALLLFVSPHCKPCQDLVGQLNENGSKLHDLPLIVIETGSTNGQSLRAKARFKAVWSNDPDGVLHRAFMTSATPHSFLIDHGVIVGQVTGTDLTPLTSLRRERSLVSR
jgi:thiol-disulfide isomerase/thioredoxin